MNSSSAMSFCTNIVKAIKTKKLIFSEEINPESTILKSSSKNNETIMVSESVFGGLW